MKQRIEIDTHLENTFMPYAMTTILDRALPDVRDGLKPVHRRILYAMMDRGITRLKDRAKSSEPVSETMKIHGHGDSSIYEALALMTEQNESLLHPFIDGEGAFGKVYNKDSPSASRYTFCRLNKFSEEMFCDIGKDTVDFIEEGGHKQPLVLPNTIPNILVKINSGIAVSQACNFPSFNLGEVCEATKHYIDDKNIDIINFINAPDFSTGGNYIKNNEEFRKIIDTGRGSLKIRGRYLYNEKDNCVEFYEIPYSTTADAIVDKITQIIKSGRFKDIVDVRDETGWSDEENKEKLKIAVEVKKKSNIDIVIAFLFANTPLEDSFPVNMNCISKNTPKVMGVKSILDEWLIFRQECIKKALTFDLNKYRKEYVLLKGLEAIVSNLDEVIKIIRGTKSDEEVISILMSTFSINEIQANYIADIKLRNLNKDYIDKKLTRLKEVARVGKEISETIEDKSKINSIIKEQLGSVQREYGIPRKTQIIEIDKATTIPKEATIEDFNCHIMVSKEGYIKKYLRLSTEDAHKLKDGDTIQYMSPTTNKSQVVVLTNKANSYIVKLHELDTTVPSNLGSYLPTQLGWDKDEKMIFVESMDEVEKKTMLFGFDSGNVAKVPLSSYISSRQKSVNAYNTKDNLIYINCVIRDLRLMFISDIDKCIMLDTSRINPKASKATRGFRCQVQKDTSKTIRIYEAREVEGEEYYCAINAGVGKYIKKEHVGLI